MIRYSDRGPLIRAVLVLGLLSTSCAGEEEFVSPIVSSNLFTGVIADFCARDNTVVDTVVFDLFTIETELATANRDPFGACTQCAQAGNSAGCTHVARACRCGGKLASFNEWTDLVQGVRFELQPERTYCLRMVALDRAQKTPQNQGPGVDCDIPECQGSLDQLAETCGLSSAFGASESEAPITMVPLSCRAIDELLASQPLADLCMRPLVGRLDICSKLDGSNYTTTAQCAGF